MRILYGVVGEGMGHAIRSRVILDHLHQRGHQVKIVASSRAFTFLAKLFPDVVEIAGLPLVYEDNAVSAGKTAMKILSEAAGYAMDNVDAYRKVIRNFEADVVISDFDSFAHLYGIRNRIPILSIDNQHAIPMLQHAEDVLTTKNEAGELVHDYHGDFDLFRRIIKGKMMGAKHYLITTFFFPPIKAKYQHDASLFPPILRDEIIEAKKRVTRGDHVLVYQTSASYTALLDILAGMEGEFRVYGYLRPDATPPAGAKEGDDIRYAPNVLVRAFSEGGFIDDLATSKAVVTGGGFTLMGEAVYLGKPIYSVPVQKQFEQIISAQYLQKLGYGEHHDSVTPEALTAFLANADAYAERLKLHRQDGNRAILAKVDSLLAALSTRHG